MDDWRAKLAEFREWWDDADPDTRYMAIMLVSGILSVVIVVLDKASPPRETLHRVWIESN
jgi:hypothetical protein